MIEIKKNYIDTQTEIAIIIGIRRPQTERVEVDEHLNELQELARTAGATVTAMVVQERVSPHSAHFIGKGKLEEVIGLIEEYSANLLIFDDELSPAQMKNISKILEDEKVEDIKVIDRTALILDIFADHAQSAEAKTQVELAQLNYLLPRLTRAWQHLSRQVGGIGTKGPGETQLETDRRLVRTRISKLHARLKIIDKQNQTRRQKRDGMFRIALVGYTNAGKSTLMNALSGADVLIEDKLFATLDTTVRRAELSSSFSALLSDTVGFIRKLPHQLVASFRSTLAESGEADLLLHIVDISHPRYGEHIDVVNSLLNELGSNVKDRLLIFNKIDCLKNPVVMEQVRATFDDAVFISAQRHIGLNNLRNTITERFDSEFCVRDIKLDIQSNAGEHLFHSFATILEKHYDNTSVYLKIKFHQENAYKVEQILKQNSSE